MQVAAYIYNVSFLNFFLVQINWCALRREAKRE